jgi:hypothetical protein
LSVWGTLWDQNFDIIIFGKTFGNKKKPIWALVGGGSGFI